MSCFLKYTPYCLNEDCNEAIEKKCASFKPYPPKMTDKECTDKSAELLKDIPEEFKGALSYMAYERGHSSGNEEVINELRMLISDLQEPIKKFEERIRAEEYNKRI